MVRTNNCVCNNCSYYSIPNNYCMFLLSKHHSNDTSDDFNQEKKQYYYYECIGR
jgi:hypothetical protein